jgi:cell division GTPase FtsZ
MAKEKQKSKDDGFEAEIQAAIGSVFEGQKKDTQDVAFSGFLPDLQPPVAEAVQRPKSIADRFSGEVAINFGFLGTGQGGGRIAASFWDLGYRRVGLFNTTELDWAGLPDGISRYCTGSGGAAKDAAFAQKVAKEHSEGVWELLSRAWGQTVEQAMICVGGGGGTGSGSVVELVNTVKNYIRQFNSSANVGVIMTLPSASEGRQVCRNAVVTLQQLISLDCTPLILMDNAKINQLYRPSLISLYPTANKIVSSLLHSFNVLAATKTSLIAFDKAEFKQLLSSKICVLGSVGFDSLESPADISEGLRNKVGNVLADVDLSSGNRAACLFLGDSKTLDRLSLDYFDSGFSYINRLLKGDSPIVHRGVYLTAQPGLSAMLLIGGLSAPYAAIKRLIDVAGITNKHLESEHLLKFLGLDD